MPILSKAELPKRMHELTLTQPDDWHLHLRDGEALIHVVNFTAKQCRRAIVMPNLLPPVINVKQALEYRQRILNALDPTLSFDPLMTLYLTNNTSKQDIQEAVGSEHVHAVKLYPAGATTNSESGVTSVENIYPTFETMQELGLPLLIHGEVTSPDIDVFDREAIFIEKTLNPICETFPALKVVFEHITTKQGVDFVLSANKNVAATITPHHLLLNRNALFQGGIQPHHYCLPILKREIHQQALLSAATSGNSKFFLGTDSAPHSKNKKESSCGCAGIFSAHAAIELYAEAFESQNALDKLEAFASFYGADFYGLERNKTKVTIKKEVWKVPASYPLGSEELVPFRAEQQLPWKLVTINE